MENQTNSGTAVPEEPQEETQAVVSRRRLLKTMAATGGTVAAWTFLPEKWTKPVVEAGELSAHAAASPVSGSIRIDELYLWNTGSDSFRGEIQYQDSAGVVSYDTARLSAFVGSDTAKLSAVIGSCGEIIFSDTFVKTITGGFVSPNPPPPTVGFQFTHNITEPCRDFCVELRAGSAVSNQKCKSLP